jgi:hypothetical protein
MWFMATGCAFRGLQVDRNRVCVPQAAAVTAKLARTPKAIRRREGILEFILLSHQRGLTDQD